MTTLKKLSLTKMSYFLLFMVATVPIAIFGFGFPLIQNALYDRDLATMSMLINQITDKVIETSGEYAKERGLTSGALAAGTIGDEAMGKILQQRASADKIYASTISMVESFQKAQPVDEAINHAMESIASRRRDLDAARLVIDNAAKNGLQDAFTYGEWASKITPLIEALSSLRIALISPSSVDGHTIYRNIYTKQLLWVAGEYAGRERALISSYIAKNKPFDEVAVANLNAWRALVDQSLKNIFDLRFSSNVDVALKNSINAMEQTFLVKFQQRRLEIHQAGKIGKYPITTQQWIAEATEGINSILATAQAVSGSAIESERLISKVKETNRVLMISISLIGFLVFFTLGTVIFCFRFLRKNLLKPLDYAMHQLGDQSETLKSMSNEIVGVTENVTTSNNDQAAAIQETVSAMAEMGSMISQTNQHTKDSFDLSKKVLEKTEEGKRIMQKMVSAMESIHQVSSQLENMSKIINDISLKTNVINDIVFKTQLLSFNASIEAARAGQHGRGFAVVAEAVGNLAQVSGSAANEIQKLLQDSQYQVGQVLEMTKARISEGQRVSEEALQSFSEIAHDVEVSTTQVQAIADAAREQELGVKQTSIAMGQMDAAAQSNNTAVNQVSRLASDLQQQSENLEKVMAMVEQLVLGHSKSATRKMEDSEENEARPQGPSRKASSGEARDIALRLIKKKKTNGDDHLVKADDDSFKKVL